MPNIQRDHASSTSQRDINAIRSLRVGDVVTVFGFDSLGNPVIEGRARISAQCGSPNQYRVVFTGERVPRTRFVLPDWQRDPERSLALLVEFRRFSTLPRFDEFFPPHPS